MRDMILVKATKDSEAGVMPSESLIAEMAVYHEELARAGVLLDGAGLQASSKGWRIHHAGDKRGEAVIEVRQVFDLDDFGESPSVDRFRGIGIGGTGDGR